MLSTLLSLLRHVSLLLVLLVAPDAAFGQRVEYDESRRLQARAITAYEAGDLRSFIDLTRDALSLRPNHPTLLYNLASGFARRGLADSALAYLGRLGDLGISLDPRSDSDFQSLAEAPAFVAASERLLANAAPTEASDTSFVLPASAQIPEAIAYDPVSEVFYVSSVFDRAIYRMRNGHVDKLIDLDAAPFEDCLCHGGTPPGSTGEANSYPTATFVGIALDPDRNVVWATQSPIPGLARIAGGGAAPDSDSSVGAPNPPAPPPEAAPAVLVKIGTRSGTTLAKYPAGGNEHAFLGDVAVDSNGTVYASETRTGALYRLRAGNDSLDALVAPGSLVSPQGIAIPPGSPFLFVADYALGIIRVDVDSGKIRPVAAPDTVMLLGIDGLLWYRDGLIAIQNGAHPQRVLRLELDQTGSSIVGAAVLESNHPAFPEPTTGTIYGDTLHYVGNSNWNLLDDAVGPPGQPPEPRLILRLALPVSRK